MKGHPIQTAQYAMSIPVNICPVCDLKDNLSFATLVKVRVCRQRLKGGSLEGVMSHDRRKCSVFKNFVGQCEDAAVTENTEEHLALTKLRGKR